MNEKKFRFLLSLLVGTLMVLTVSAKANTADNQRCPAGEVHVCYTANADGTLDKIAVDNHGHAVDREEDCEDASTDVLYGCQPLEAVRAEEHKKCDELGRPYFWSETRGGRCVEQRPRDTPPAQPPAPPQPPIVQAPPAPPFVQTPPTPPITTPPQGGSQTGGTNLLPSGGITPPPATCPACPGCTCEAPPMGPDPCADVPGLAEELAPLEQLSPTELVVRGTDGVRTRVTFIRFRAGECNDGALYARADSLLEAMEPPPPPPLVPQPGLVPGSDSGDEGDWCSDNPVACGFLIAGAILAGGAVVTTGILLGTDYHLVQP